MPNMKLGEIDRKLLSLVQVEFPLTNKPYNELGLKLGIKGDDVIQRIQQQKAKGVIRQISPVLDARRLGYRATLVAMQVAKNQLDKASKQLGEHSGVSHCYERDHLYNLWFTLAVHSKTDMQTELTRLTDSIDAEDTFALPAVKLFKIGTYFDVGGNGRKDSSTLTHSGSVLPEEVELSQIDRLIINELQQDLSLIATPFSAMAARLGMDIEDFLAHCRSLLKRGIMRRFGAAVNHRKAGFNANAMACWIVPPDAVDMAGKELASIREVSHCYERKTNPRWQHNIFAMVHGHSKEVCEKMISDVSHRIGLGSHIILFSTKELKKVRVKYLV
jgi:DNA-binding Lrp family transcriptional regulator